MGVTVQVYTLHVYLYRCTLFWLTQTQAIQYEDNSVHAQCERERERCVTWAALRVT